MLEIFWKNATSGVVGEEHGLTPGDLANAEHDVKKAYEQVISQVNSDQLGYAKLPHNNEYLTQVLDMVDRYRDTTTDMLVLGIGGSALGNIAIQAALNPVTYNM